MIAIVTGGRDYAGERLTTALDELYDQGITWLMLGDCPTGADKMALDWSEESGSPSLTHRADWGGRGRRAGPERNQRMVIDALRLQLEAGPPMLRVLCLAAPGGRGTADCVRRARKPGIEVRELPW